METIRDVEVVQHDLRNARVVDGIPLPTEAADGTAERVGADEILGTWTQAVDGQLDPRHGIICSW